MQLDDPIRAIPRWGSRYEKKCTQLKITTLRDLLLFFPTRYDDRSRMVAIAAAPMGSPVTIRAQLVAIQTRRAFRARMMLTEGLLRDASGSVKVLWFRSPYIARALRVGDEFFFSGVIRDEGYGPTLTHPEYEPVSSVPEHTGRIVALYPLRDVIAQKPMRTLVGAVLPLAKGLDDVLPSAVRAEHHLCAIGDAVRTIHTPASMDDVRASEHRFSFEELLVMQLRAALLRRKRASQSAPAVPFQEGMTRAFVASLPFTLTNDQRVAAWDIVRAMEHPAPMYRLLEGDVGSGKTIVAAIALLNAAREGLAIYLAPTTTLAEQQFAALARFFAREQFSVGLVTASRCAIARGSRSEATTRGEIKKALREGTCRVLVGTHALMRDTGLPRDACVFVVVDEQHRFGVAQRAALTEVRSDGRVPHFLSMTATPIPRTLARSFFGDLAVSTIRQKPKAQKPIRTHVVPKEKREKMVAFIRERLTQGEQALIVFPLIDPSEALAVKAVTDEVHALERDAFPSHRVAFVHGRQRANDRRAIMEQFVAGAVHVLAATAVVEVGIDVPNATIMVIENAERFGLAQLHQFRGRVGRGDTQSYCFLMTDAVVGDPAMERLRMLEQTNDGFLIAEKDLELRGPGTIAGIEQSGFQSFRFASFGDYELFDATEHAAESLLADDPLLERNPGLREQVFSRDVVVTGD